MTIDFTKPVLVMPDGSYVVAVSNPSYPQYNVTSDPEFAPLWASIQEWLAAGNTAAPYVPPAPVAPDPKIAAQATLHDLMLKYVNSIMVGPSAPLTYAPAWLAAWKAAGMP